MFLFFWSVSNKINCVYFFQKSLMDNDLFSFLIVFNILRTKSRENLTKLHKNGKSQKLLQILSFLGHFLQLHIALKIVPSFRLFLLA